MGIPPETRTVLEREEREGKGGRVIRGNGIFAAARGEAEVFPTLLYTVFTTPSLHRARPRSAPAPRPPPIVGAPSSRRL